MEIIIIVALLAILISEKYYNRVERKEMIEWANAERAEMLDRLMSKTLPEFKDNQTPEENVFEEESNEIDLLDADSEVRKEINGKEE